MFRLYFFFALISTTLLQYLLPDWLDALSWEEWLWEMPLSAVMPMALPGKRQGQSAPSDAELVRAYQHTRDLTLIHQLIEQHQGLIYAISRRFTTRTFTCEDVKQELILLLEQKLPELTVRSSLKGWLSTTLRNWLIDRQRKEHSHDNYCSYQKVHGTHVELPAEERYDQQNLVKQAMSLLRAEEAHCVRLHYLEGRSYQEIAEELGWSFKKVTGHMYRALKRLRAKMDSQALADCLQR